MEGLRLIPKNKLIDLDRNWSGQKYTYLQLYRWIMSEYDRAESIGEDVPIISHVDRDGNLMFKMVNGWRVSNAAKRALISHEPIAYLKD